MGARRVKAKDLADQIRGHLLDLEARGGFDVLYPDGYLPLKRPHAWAAGPYVMIAYREDMKTTCLTREKAAVYLAWLAAGGAGDFSQCLSPVASAYNVLEGAQSGTPETIDRSTYEKEVRSTGPVIGRHSPTADDGRA